MKHPNEMDEGALLLYIAILLEKILAGLSGEEWVQEARKEYEAIENGDT